MSINLKTTLTALSLVTAACLPLTSMASSNDHQLDQEAVKAFGLITTDDAKARALKEVPGAVVREIELDNDKHRKGWQYEVELVDAQGKEWEVKLDAKTGGVIKVKKDWF